MRIYLDLILAIVVALAVTGGSPLLGQQDGPPEVPDVPWEAAGATARWWTLTDEITPGELRSILGDVELHRERYLDAVMAGRRRLLSEERMELLRTFVDGKSHPELFPMWVVFESFSGDFLRQRERRPRESLVEFGIEGETLRKLLPFISGYLWERPDRVTDREKQLQGTLEFARLADERMGSQAFEAAVRAEDIGSLADATGYRVEQVEEVFATWRRQPVEDYTIEMLPRLKTVLGPTGWEQFRAYLFEVKAPLMVTITAAVDDETFVQAAPRPRVY